MKQVKFCLFSLVFAVAAFGQGGLDQYGGSTAMQCPGGPASNFYTQKIGDRWWLCTPAGNVFWMTGVWAVTGSGSNDELGASYDSRFQRKYGSDRIGWPQANRRLKSWGFNTVGPYSYRMVYASNSESPGDWPPDGTHPVKMPFLADGPCPNVECIDAGVCKNLWAGINPAVFNAGSAPGFADVFNPAFTTFTNNLYANDSRLAGFKNSPYFIGYMSEDTDWISGFAAGGDFTTDPPGKEWAHNGLIALATAPTQGGATVHTKLALRDFLISKYGTIAALNSAWGSNYTTFNSSGGWPTGSGLLDEDGRASHTWLGNPVNFESLAGMNAQVKADLDDFLCQLAGKYMSVNRAAFKAVAPNSLFFGSTQLGGAGWRAPSWGPVLKAGGEHLDVVPVSTDGSQAQLDYIARWAGDVPLIIWEGVVANPDSGRWRHNLEPATWVVSTQEERGRIYQRDVEALVNGTVTGTRSRPFVGLLFWSWRDHLGERTNWGLVSYMDNAYDGKEARVAAGTDPWGYPTGGEERNYGDFISYVRNANLSVYSGSGSSKPATTTTVGSSLNPSFLGQQITLTATVTASSGTPTGNVQFFDGTSSLGTAVLNGGRAAISTLALAVGTHSITAVYGGDATFSGSTSAQLLQTVDGPAKIPTSTAVSSSANPSPFGQSVSFTATVSAADGTPTGAVEFRDGSASLGTAGLTNGQTSITISALSAGTHSITAVYGGDANYNGSTSPALQQTVSAVAPGPGSPVIRINAGGPAYTDPQGRVWSADTGFSAGDTYSVTEPVANTTTPVLYQSERYGTNVYNFSLPNGPYRVTLKFAEIWFKNPGQRVFNVAANGQPLLTNFDIVAAVGPGVAVDKQFSVAVTSGTLAIQFTPVADLPKISAIEIEPQSAVVVTVNPISVGLSASQVQQFVATVAGADNKAVTWSVSPPLGSISPNGLYTAPSSILSALRVTITATSVADPTKSGTASVELIPPGTTTVIRINAGGPSYTDPQGRVWSADTGFSAGDTYSVTEPVANTTTPVLYQSERYGMNVYNFSLPNGAYRVTLKFAEIWFKIPEQRVFNVSANGQPLLTNFDIVAAVGPGVAVDKQFSVAVTSGTLAIQFTPVADLPKISAIEIEPQSGVVVAINPISASLSASQAQQFVASVAGAGNTAVTWSVSPPLGSISPNGLYTAPPYISSTLRVTITATSVADPTKSATASVELVPPGTATVIRVNAGGPSYTDPQGRVWSADTGFSAGETYSVNAQIANTTTPVLYQSERWGAMTYRFSVPNGIRTVNLKFAEIWFKRTEQRAFNVSINGQPVLTNFDIVAEAGRWRVALDKQFSVLVTGGEVTVHFSPVADEPKLSAIEIY